MNTSAGTDDPIVDVSEADVDAAIRVDQTVTVVRMVPLMMISNFGVPLAMLLAVWGSVPTWFAAGWLAVILALEIPVILSWRRLRASARPSAVSARRIRGIAIWSTLMGMTIAAGSFYLYPIAGEASQILTVICTLGLWTGALIATWKIPAALYGYCAPMVAGLLSVVSLNYDTAIAGREVLITLGLFVLLAFWAVRIHQAYYRESTRTQLEHGTQSVEIKRRREAEAQLQKSLADLRDAQDKLILQEKMASLGAVTAGVAHEIKNPLNFIINFARLSDDLADQLRSTTAPVIEHLGEDDRADVAEDWDLLTENLQRITEHGRRADGIVRSMLMHSRTDPGTRAPVRMADLIDEAIDLAYHGFRAQDPSFNVRIDRDLAEGLPAIHGSQSQLMRVMLNLIRNALQAARERAKEEGPGFDPAVRIRACLDDTLLMVEVEDNGPGIAPENLGKLFQPFFTTKAPGEGTGLGLSISFDIVQQHGGELRVTSQPGQQTTFTVVLPTTVDAVIALSEARKKGEMSFAGSVMQ